MAWPSLKKLVRALAGVRLPFVQYVASLAVVHAIQEQARARLGVRHAHATVIARSCVTFVAVPLAIPAHNSARSQVSGA